MTIELTELLIDPKRWARGRVSQLLEADGKMCCLGFAAKACGYEDDAILNKGTLGDVVANGQANLFPESLVIIGKTSDFGVKAIVINDDVTLNETERRQRLRLLFYENGIKLLFSDEKIAPQV